jgi:hypothetical protein
MKMHHFSMGCRMGQESGENAIWTFARYSFSSHFFLLSGLALAFGRMTFRLKSPFWQNFLSAKTNLVNDDE